MKLRRRQEARAMDILLLKFRGLRCLTSTSCGVQILGARLELRLVSAHLLIGVIALSCKSSRRLRVDLSEHGCSALLVRQPLD